MNIVATSAIFKTPQPEDFLTESCRILHGISAAEHVTTQDVDNI